jgi:hypothetical protein
MPGRVYAIRSGPVYLFKIDISDGFYRISIRSEEVPKLAIMFPTGTGEERLIVQPLALPMGWTPPLFNAATEKVADLANRKLRAKHASFPHRLDALSETAIKPEEDIFNTLAGPESLPLSTPALWHQPSKMIPDKSWDT